MEERFKMIYAYKGSSIVNISDVESGLKCGCICPACNKPLVAKKGMKKMHHFAHHTKENCEYGYESSLHLAAKEILSNAEKMVIPPVYIKFPYSSKCDELLYDARSIKIDKVELEQHFDSIIPDVVLYSGGKKFFVEIYVTHRIDAVKLKKLREAGTSTIEVNLSEKAYATSIDELKEILLSNCPEKQWIYNIRAEEWLEKFISVSDKKYIEHAHEELRVYDCPIYTQNEYGNPYVNYLEACHYCEYHITSNQDKNFLFCSGIERISSIKDFDTSKENRKKFSLSEKLKEIYPEHNALSNSLFKCKCCGKLFSKKTMVFIDMRNDLNEGICRECSKTRK